MQSHNRRFKDARQRVFWGAFALSLTAIVGPLGAGTVWAQPSFPAKPVRISIPYGAGGVADLTMRLLAQKLTERTKQQVVIENRPGAGGLLSAPDLVTAVLRGDVDVGFDFYAGLQAVISDNQVRIIATSGEERNPLLRDVPTAKESGFPEYIVTSWNGLAGAAGVPTETVTILNQHINAALSDPALQATASTLGMDARGSTPQEMRDRMAADVKKWAAVIEKAG